MILFLPNHNQSGINICYFSSIPQGSVLRNPSSGQCLELKASELKMEKCDEANVHQRWEFSWPASRPTTDLWPTVTLNIEGSGTRTFSTYDVSCCRGWASPQWELWRWTWMEAKRSVNHPRATFDFKCIYGGNWANEGKTIGRGFLGTDNTDLPTTTWRIRQLSRVPISHSNFENQSIYILWPTMNVWLCAAVTMEMFCQREWFFFINVY